MEHKRASENKLTPFQRILTLLGTVLCIVFSFTLICNLTIIIKGSIEPDVPPSVFGTTPLVVLSGSMSSDAEDHIEVGDLIFVGKVQPEELEEGDIIAFMQGSSAVTHRIVGIETSESGSLKFSTKGDANNAVDSGKVDEDDIIGVFKGRIPKVGDFAIFLQTPLGMVIFVGVPLAAFIMYDIIRRQRSAHKENKKTAELEAEIERLRAIAGGSEGSGE